MTEVTSGHLALPQEVCRRYGMTPNTTIRIIETPSGVLLVPLTNEPMHQALLDELQQWQTLAVEGWEQFPYGDETP